MMIRPIQAEDDVAIARVIRQVGAEFGAIGEGFGPSDEEVNAMSLHYGRQPGSQYWVVIHHNQVVGGGGLAPFNGSNQVCELKKLFLLPSCRGQGIGKALVQCALEFATECGFQQCYLDTLATMTAAIQLYQSFGFVHLDQPIAGTPHGGCDVWMLKDLANDPPV